MATAGVQGGEPVLEIGPGLGSLTLALLDRGARVTAVEIDPALAAALPQTVADRLPARAAGLRVLTADARTLQPSALPEAPLHLVANLPYNVAVGVLLGVLDRLPSVRSGLVLVQAEVARRLAASPGSRIYGIPSVKAAWYAHVRLAGAVPRSVFWPAPNVDSALVAFTRRDPPGDPALREAVFAVVDAAFATRRKTLRAALAGWAGGSVAAERALRAAGIDPAARGETLDVAAFTRLAAARPAAP